jgi:hypothetical protein
MPCLFVCRSQADEFERDDFGLGEWSKFTLCGAHARARTSTPRAHAAHP